MFLADYKNRCLYVHARGSGVIMRKLEINPFVGLEKASVKKIAQVVRRFYGEDVSKIFSEEKLQFAIGLNRAEF